MNRTVYIILITFFTTCFFVSCSDSGSLQRYFVDNQESKNFVTQDIPISMLKVDTSKLSPDQKDAYNSVSRLNFLGFKANETNANDMKVELAKVNAILKEEAYNDLMEFSDKGNKIVVKYVGEDDKADEFIILGNSKDLGFGIVRVLGDDMSPDKMVTLVNVLQKADIQEGQFQNMINFFK